MYNNQQQYQQYSGQAYQGQYDWSAYAAQQQQQQHAVPPTGQTPGTDATDGASGAAQSQPKHQYGGWAAPQPAAYAYAAQAAQSYQAYAAQYPAYPYQAGYQQAYAGQQAHTAAAQQKKQVTKQPKAATASAPAFVKVAAAPKPQPAKPASASEHPPALRNFVMRFFARGNVTDSEKEALKKLISDAKDKGELWTRDWDNTPLPSVNNLKSGGASKVPTVTPMPTTRPQVMLRAQGPKGGALGGSALLAAKQQAQQIAASLSAQVARKRQHIEVEGVAQNTQNKIAKLQIAKTQAAANKLKQQLQAKNKWHAGKTGKKYAASTSTSDEDDQQVAEDEETLDPRELERRRRRAGRFGDGATEDFATNKAKARRAAVVDQARRRRAAEVLAEQEADEVDWDSLVIRGTCKNLEKSYFRLTSAPDPATVRPEEVVRRAYYRLVDMLMRGEANYFYALDQFKGQRQDLTVQHIKNDLTVLVYEAHARSALEYGDLAEFNQCQTQVHMLYNQGVPGCRHEFLAYRLLYQTVHAKHGGQGTALLSTLQGLTKEDAQAPAVRHALAVRTAVARYDWVNFFRLYATAPALGRCLMDVYVATARRHAVDAFVRACKPTVPVLHMAHVLGFVGRQDSGVEGGAVLAGCRSPAGASGKHLALVDVEEGLERCCSWLAASNATITGNDAQSAMVDCKASSGNIITPPDTDAVAHGDANLAIDDFLSRAL